MDRRTFDDKMNLILRGLTHATATSAAFEIKSFVGKLFSRVEELEAELVASAPKEVEEETKPLEVPKEEVEIEELPEPLEAEEDPTETTPEE